MLRAVVGARHAWAAVWRRWPLALTGIGVMLLGPLICWSLVFSRGSIAASLAALPLEVRPWLAVVGALAISVGWGLIGAQLRPWGSRVVGAAIGSVLYFVVGWAWFFRLAVIYGHRPLDLLVQPVDLGSLRIFAMWPIFAASALGLITLS
jgi:hypothetical protein